jgi:hypothetical protein
MQYLPLQCILRKSLILPLRRKFNEVILPRNLCKLEAAATVADGRRVRIFPTQSFHLGALNWNVHWRQHRMPHNGELATTLQTTCYNSLGRMIQFESLTFLSTPDTELYQASYLLQEVLQACYQVPLTEPRPLEWHRFHLLERERGQNEE